MPGRKKGSRGVAAALASVCLSAATAQALPAPEAHPRGMPEDPAPIVVFFEPGSSDIPNSAQPLANRALAAALKNGEWHVTIEPFVDSTAGEQVEAIAEERARNLVAFFAANGVPEWRVEAGPVRGTRSEDPVIGIDANRVEISFQFDNSAAIAQR